MIAEQSRHLQGQHRALYRFKKLRQYVVTCKLYYSLLFFQQRYTLIDPAT